MNKAGLKELLNKMTLDEKIGQLIQVIGSNFLDEEGSVTTGPVNDLGINEQMLYNVGSLLNVAGAENIRKIQEKYLAKNRLKIPLLFMADVINGFKTVFPIPLAQGCSWNTKVLEECARITANEANLSGVNVNFSPMVDLVRDARWGRVMESAGGEDVYLGKLYAKTVIEAYQGNDISKQGNLAACVKHFAAYGAVESGREYNTVDISKREFLQNYLPPYKAAIDSKCELVMTSFNILNGVPCTINKTLLNDILRKQLKFEGVVISDYGAIEETVKHGAAKDLKQAALKAILAGVDIDMMSKAYVNNLKQLCMENKQVENKVNESVLRVLNLKNKLGLFENPYGNLSEEKQSKYVMCSQNLNKAKELTEETFVLLKNKDDILPLNKDKKIALIGPYAQNKQITSSWTMFSNDEQNKTIKDVIEKILPKENLLYAKGSEVLQKDEINAILEAWGKEKLPVLENEKEQKEKLIKEAVDVARKSDIILLAVGEHYLQSGESCSRANIDLPNIQKDLINELSKLNKPIIMILFNGRPLAIGDIQDKVDAILDVWMPGTMGAEAIVDTIFGKNNPSGKLVMSFPQNAGQCPIYYNGYSTGRPHTYNFKYLSRYQDIPTKSLYPFGYGLSYCKFKYSNLNLDKKILTQQADTINVTVKVENQSNYEGDEVVQLYIQDLFGNVVRPVKELKAFQKVHFKAYETKTIEFKINLEMLKFYNYELEYIVEEGQFKVFIGGNSEDVLEDEFCYNQDRI